MEEKEKRRGGGGGGGGRERECRSRARPRNAKNNFRERHIGVADRGKRAPAICDSRRKGGGGRGWVRSQRVELVRRERERGKEREAQASSIMQRAVTERDLSFSLSLLALYSHFSFLSPSRVPQFRRRSSTYRRAYSQSAHILTGTCTRGKRSSPPPSPRHSRTREEELSSSR